MSAAEWWALGVLSGSVLLFLGLYLVMALDIILGWDWHL